MADPVGIDEPNPLLDALEEADGALRALYGALAANPDRAAELEVELGELRASRLDLAQRVGLAALAARRVGARPPRAEATPSESAPTLAETDPPVPAATPEPAAGEPSPPPVPPASDAQLAEWKSAVRSNGLGSGLRTLHSAAAAWPLVLHELMETLGPPRDRETSVAVIEELDALDEVSVEERQREWARLPKHVQQLWLSMLVARTRVLKESRSWAETNGRMKQINARYPPWAKAHTPGHVNGMQLKHAPLHGSWAHDARHYWERLGDLLGEELVVRPPPAARRKAKAQELAGDDPVEIDPSWHVLPQVRGRRAIILGGDPREPNRQRLERAFQLASLEWPSIEGPRKVAAVVERIGRRSYDLVLLLAPFLFHKQSDPLVAAAKAAGVDWALVEGYGVSSVKLGLERFLGGPRSGPSLPADGE